jgi:hypothetical protein
MADVSAREGGEQLRSDFQFSRIKISFPFASFADGDISGRRFPNRGTELTEIPVRPIRKYNALSIPN